MGKQCNDVEINAYCLPYASHMIYYIYDNQYVVVFAVLHKNILPELHLDDRNSI